MKIIRIIARLNVGGPARHVVWLTAGLKDCETLLVAGTVPPGEDDMSYFATEAGIRPHFIPEMSREISVKDAVTIWKLYRLFRRERPDVVHTHTAKAGTVGRIAGFCYRWLTPATLWGRPRRCLFVHTYHGHIFHSYYGALKTRIFLAIEKLLARTVTDRIITISPQQFHEIHETFGVGRAEQFAVVPLGLDTSVFTKWQERREPLRDELNASAHDRLIGIVGRLTEIKNHELFLKAVAHYKSAHGVEHGKGRVRFIIIGDGQLRRALEEQAGALGLSRDVTFTGTRNDAENFYPALDTVALSSRNEGTPLTLIEAMANARACVATAVGGVVDLFGKEREENSGKSYTVCERGILVQAGDVEGLSNGIARLVEDEELRRELGQRGLEFVTQNYSKERLLANIENLYQELVQEKSVASSSISRKAHISTEHHI
ncbi:MAG: glycosyltransferase [Pyrinomonadaceae bacterium]